MSFAKSAIWAAIAGFGIVTSAQAAVVTLENITATWQNPVGGSNVTYDDNGTDFARVRWGTASSGPNTFGNRSGYDFEAVGSSISTGIFTTPYSSPAFTVGTFTHQNKPIVSGGGISAMQLFLTADISINGGLQQSYNFTFNFLHHETPNGAKPCAYGGANYQGININGCADKVSVNFSSISDSFFIDGTRYTLNLAGFLDGGQPATDFLSKEKGSNNAIIVGQIAAWDDVIPGVPEPSTWLTMIAGFGLVGYQMRRRKGSVSADRIAA